MAGTRGGARPGAGRKSNPEKYEQPLVRFSDLAADHLEQVYRNLEELADGRAEAPEEEWRAAGTVTRKDLARDKDGSVVKDKNGKATIVQVLVFPEKPADELVLLGRKVRHLPPDFRANELLVNRLGGTPIPAPQPDPEGLDLAEALGLAVAAIAARMARPEALDGPEPLPPDLDPDPDDESDR